MGKSRAQIQKEYRERKKQTEGKEYLKKESTRVLKYYVPSAELNTSKRKARNEKAKVRNRKYRLDKKEKLQNHDSASGYESMPDNQLIVRMPFESKGKGSGGKKKYTRALARAHASLKSVKAEKEKYKKKYKAKLRQYERLQKKISSNRMSHSGPSTNIDGSPLRSTESELSRLQLTPRSSKKVRRKLLEKNTLLNEIKSARKSTNSKKETNLISRIVSGKIMKKYRCVSAISNGIGISRRLLNKSSGKVKGVRPDRRVQIVKRMEASIENFLGREDNSRTQPGKADVMKSSDGTKKQTKVLTDYLANLHRKFCAENPNVKISLATFCRLRPKYILPAKFICRTSCLCIKHQNMALKCQALKQYGVSVSENPENLIGRIEEVYNDMYNKVPNEVSYKVWKQVQVEEKKKMKIVEIQILKEDFISLVQAEIAEFENHVTRVKSQYRELKTLKENLPLNEVIVQMDFAENYSCKTLAEIQSAYWNQTPVTIHPVVFYFGDQDGKLQHKSIAIISDELSHSTSTVCAFLDALIPTVQSAVPNATKIHYWTDSPSSQYRNKTMFTLIAEHTKLYGLKARWNYFESGHGKGPCDGLGGTVKRMADEAIKRGVVVIQDPREFYEWAINSNLKEVKFLFVSKEDCQKKADELHRCKLKPFKGTMKLHAVGFDTESLKLRSRETSCYCSVCISGKYCESWDSHIIPSLESNCNIPCNNEATVSPSGSHDGQIDLSVNDVIACIYENKWYIGKVLNVDEIDVEVTFMEKVKNMYRWPTHSDILWVNKENVLCKLYSLQASGKTERLWKLSQDELAITESIFEKV